MPAQRHRRRSQRTGIARQRSDRFGVGLAAAIHLYSTLELQLPPELNGPEFLVDLMVDGLEIQGATVMVPDAPGLGLKVKEDKIRANEIPV